MLDFETQNSYLSFGKKTNTFIPARRNSAQDACGPAMMAVAPLNSIADNISWDNRI